jgi:hypothetical protein
MSHMPHPPLWNAVEIVCRMPMDISSGVAESREAGKRKREKR